MGSNEMKDYPSPLDERNHTCSIRYNNGLFKFRLPDSRISKLETTEFPQGFKGIIKPVDGDETYLTLSIVNPENQETRSICMPQLNRVHHKELFDIISQEQDQRWLKCMETEGYSFKIESPSQPKE